MTWEALDAALEACAKRTGAAPAFWWRDDDLEAPSAALETMLDLRRRVGVPLAVATIAATAGESLARHFRGESDLTVVQHGYDHSNHAGPGAKKSELAEGRDPSVVVAQLREGRARLEAIFSRQFRPVLVPPWNRIDSALVPRLPGAGFEGLSSFSGKKPLPAVPGLRRADCHIDVIDWHHSRGFVGTPAAIAQATAALERAPDAIGLLTHHRVMDAAAWDFVAAFVDRVKAAGGLWRDVMEAARDRSVTLYRYPFGAIRRDLTYGVAGFVLCAAPLLLDLASVVSAVLIPGAILCGVYGLRALLRLRLRVAVTDDTVTVSGPVPILLRSTSLRWDSLTTVSLGSYSAWREGEDGWMELRLKGARGTIRLESTLEGFRDIVRRAALAASAKGLVVDASTAGNLKLLDVAVPAQESEGG